MKIKGFLTQHKAKPGTLATNPYLLSLVAALIVILILPFRFPKYSLTLADKAKMDSVNLRFSYEDVDGNGYSDRIVCYNNPVKTCAVSVMLSPSLQIQEWDFPGKFQFNSTDFLVCDDYTGDGKRRFSLSRYHTIHFISIVYFILQH